MREVCPLSHVIVNFATSCLVFSIERLKFSQIIRTILCVLGGALRTLFLFKRVLHFQAVRGFIAFIIIVTSSALAHGATIEDAAAAGDAATLRTMLEADPALALAKEADGTTPLHLAALYGRADAVRVLLGFHADVSARDDDGDTPLHLAAARGWQEIALLLLASRADVNARDAHGATALHAAVFYKRDELAKLLLARHAEVEAADDNGDTPLHMAAEAGSVEMAEMLVANHAALNARNVANGTPLHAALFFKHEDVARFLREHGGHE
jgi:ankyrin repeat protein